MVVLELDLFIWFWCWWCNCSSPLLSLPLGVVDCSEEEPVFSVALLSVLGVVVSVVCCVLDSVAELELAGACASVVEEEATGASAFTSALA